MFDNVIVGIDGRQGGRDAIALARQLAAPGAVITLASVFDPGWRLGETAPQETSAERTRALELLEHERDEAAITAELVPYGCRPIGRGLHELAVGHKADLLVVGSSRRAPLGRVLLGDDTHAALNGSPCAVAVASHGYATAGNGVSTIGVGYDGSPASALALSTARALAAAAGAEVTALCVVSLEEVSRAHPQPADWQRGAAELVNERARQLARLEGVHGQATYGGPREELEQLSRRVDLLVLGSRGYGPARHLFHGSISGHVVRHAACPVLVLPLAAPASTASKAERPARSELLV